MVSRKEDLENGGGWNVRKGKKKLTFLAVVIRLPPPPPSCWTRTVVASWSSACIQQSDVLL